MKKYLLPILIACIPLVYAIYLFDNLPEIIPIHFNMEGIADRQGIKNHIFIGGALALFVFLILEFSLRFDPKKKLIEMGSNFDNFKLALIVIMSILGCIMVYTMSNGFDKNSLKFLFITISCVNIILGNYFFSVRPNFFIGVRTPWTLESETVWLKTHRLAAKLFMGIGLIGVVIAWFFTTIFIYLLIGSTLFVSIILIGYSYQQFKLEKATNNA
jgi:uncharacterized membrane protein